MADQTYSDFLSSFAKKTEGQKREDSEESYEDALKQWELDKKTIEDFKRDGIALPEGFEEKVDQMEETLAARAPVHEEKKPRDLSTYMKQDQKMSAREKDPWWKRARRTESARSMLGPEVGFVGEHKPAGSYIDKHGVIGAAFRPTPMIDWIPTFTEKERDSTAKKIGKGGVNAVVNVVKSLGSLGGLATMGTMGGLSSLGIRGLPGAAKAGKATGTVTGWGRARDAEAALKAGHKLFALDLTRNVLEHNPEVRRIMYDPNASAQEKSEAIWGHLILAGFAAGAYKGGFKKEMSKAKTPKEAVEAYNKWADIQRKNQSREIEGKKTDKQMLEQEAREIELTRKTEKPMLEQEARELELARRVEEAKKVETTIPEQEIIEMARAEKAAKLIEPVKEAEKPSLEAEPEAGSEAAYYEKPTPPVEAKKLESFDRADDGKVYVERQIDIEEFPEKFNEWEVEEGIDYKSITEPINEALFDPNLTKRGELERQRLEIRNQIKELQAKGVFEGRINEFPKEMMDKWVELVRDKGDALERWEADHKELYDQYRELEKQNKLLYEKYKYNSSIEEVLTRESLEHHDLVKQEPLTFDTTYHVTRTVNVPSLMKEGIISGGGESFKGVDPSHPNYKALMERGEVGGVGASLGRVHSFESLNDAVAWAAKMDWELASRAKRESGDVHGSGEISIIPIKGGKDVGWQLDPQLAKSGDKGLRRFGNVLPEYLGEPIKVDKNLFDAWSKSNREGTPLRLEEPPKPTDPVIESLKEEKIDPVVESLKEEKIEDVARGEAEIAEAKEAKVVEAAEGTLVPQTDRVRRFHKITKRHLEMVKDDPSEVASWIENPDSAYDAMPTSRVAKVIETFKIPEIDEQLQKLSDGELSVERALLEQRRIDLLRQRYLKDKTTENEAAYKDAVQDSANESTFLGQLIQARAFFKASDPTVTADLIEAAIKKNKGPKLTKAERKTLVERVEKAQKAQEIADKTANAFHESRTDANWESAVKALRDAEAAKIEQLDFIMDKNPKEFTDLVVSFLQGNYLTPTTIAVNVFGNIAPLPARAGARTAARGIDVIEQYLMRPRRESERARLVSEQEVNPTAKNAARLEKLERMLSPMEQMRLSPKKGSWEKIKGLADATGIKRLYKAAKEAKKGGITLKKFLKEYEREGSGPIKSDFISSMLLGDRVNIYETGTLDMGNMTAPVDAVRAGGRLYELMTNKKGEVSSDAKTVAKDIVETTFGAFPTAFFRALAATDVPFRGAEMRRIISEQGEIRGWDKKTVDRAMQHPELVFGEKDWVRIKNEAARATFQQENIGTKNVAKFNNWLKEKNSAAYLIWRNKTPYQKTLINLFSELVNYTPAGIVDVAGKTYKEGFLTKDAKISAGKVVTGTAALSLAQYLLDNDIVSADLDPYMSDPSDTKKVRYMTEQSFHHGFINMSALGRWQKGDETAYQQGDWLVDLRRMGPMGFILLNNANWHRQMEKLPSDERKKVEESWANMMKERTVKGLTHSARFGINTTMATGIRDWLQGWSAIINDKDFSKSRDSAARDLLTVFLPNTLNWFTQMNSPYRQTFKPDGFTDALKAEWRKKVASQWDGKELVEGYPIISDLWGTPLESVPEGTSTGLGRATWQKTASGELDNWDRFMSSTFNIVKLKKSGAILDPYSSEVHRLWRKFSKSEAVPSLPSREMTVDGKKYKLNRDQYVYFSALAGRYRLLGKQEIKGQGTRAYMEKHDGVAQFIGGPDSPPSHYMERYTDEEKVKELKRIYGKQLKFAQEDAFKHFANPKEDGLTKMFNINIKNLPIKPEQEVKDPSGRVESD